eukprot:TRINITY_DN11877_c0_g1_i1.p1 TRINITY_DN11877_c0_g1~~TRINITY_DN11877_c0_g1_i1.p1  ORF type:complete len:410 (-),score=56.69 TRINITY_DN11877_c0_g1_i1:896-2125(-)
MAYSDSTSDLKFLCGETLTMQLFTLLTPSPCCSLHHLISQDHPRSPTDSSEFIMPTRSGRAFILQSWYDRAQSETHSQGPDSTLLALAAAGDVPRMLTLLYPPADSEQTRGAGLELAESDHQHQRQPHHAAPPRRLQRMASSRSEPGRLCQLAHQGTHPRLSIRGQPSSYGGLDDRDADGNTPLMVGLQHEQVRAACLLMQAGADVALLSNCGAGALLSACLVGGGSLMAVDTMLRKGAPVDPPPALVTVPGHSAQQRLTPLMAACISGCAETVSLLINYGADVNRAIAVVSESGLRCESYVSSTVGSEAGGIMPLMCTCIWGHGDVAAALIEHDASMLSVMRMAGHRLCTPVSTRRRRRAWHCWLPASEAIDARWQRRLTQRATLHCMPPALSDWRPWSTRCWRPTHP